MCLPQKKALFEKGSSLSGYWMTIYFLCHICDWKCCDSWKHLTWSLFNNLTTDPLRQNFCLHKSLLLSFRSLSSHPHLRAWRSAKVCTALPQLNLQSQGSKTGPLPIGPVPGHGGCYRSGGGALSGVHRVGQSWEENLPPTGTRGETWFCRIVHTNDLGKWEQAVYPQAAVCSQDSRLCGSFCPGSQSDWPPKD